MLRSTPMKQNKDPVKNSLLMCGVNAWVHTLRVQWQSGADVSMALYTDSPVFLARVLYSM